MRFFVLLWNPGTCRWSSKPKEFLAFFSLLMMSCHSVVIRSRDRDTLEPLAVKEISLTSPYGRQTFLNEVRHGALFLPRTSLLLRLYITSGCGYETPRATSELPTASWLVCRQGQGRHRARVGAFPHLGTVHIGQRRSHRMRGPVRHSAARTRSSLSPLRARLRA